MDNCDRKNSMSTYLDNEFRQLFRNLTYPARTKNLDVEKWVKHCKQEGATTVFLDINSGVFAQWNTKLVPRDPVLGDRDLGSELSHAAKKHGLKFCFYLHPHVLDSIGAEHDDWQARTADGGFESKGCSGFTTIFCLNSGYRDLISAMLREISEKYRPHGFYLDGLSGYFTGCYCKYCQAKYMGEFGRSIPIVPDWSSKNWYEYLKWRYRQQEEAAFFVHETIHGVDPKISIVWNGSDVSRGWYCAESPAKAKWLNIACVELVIENKVNPIYRKRFPTFTYDDLLAWGIAVTRSFQDGHRAQTYQYFQPNTQLAEAVTTVNVTIAAGAQVCIQEHCKHTKAVLNRIKKTEPYLIDSISAADVALHFSDLAHNTFYHPENYSTDISFYNETGGVFFGLLSNHFPTEIVHDDWLEKTEMNISQFRTIILPNSVCLLSAATQKLQNYVKNGGSIVVSMETGLRNSYGKRQGNELLWLDSGLKFVEEIETVQPRKLTPDNIMPEEDIPAVPDQFLVFNSTNNMKKWIGEDITLGKRPDGWERYEGLQFAEFPSCQLPAKAIEVTADRSWRTLLKLRFRRSKEKGWQECPAVVTRPYGKGQITYVNFQIGTLISATGHIWWRNLFKQLVAETAGRAPVQIQAATCIKYFIWHQPAKRRFVLYLVNGLSSVTQPEQMREDHVPMPVKLKIALPGIKSVRAVIGGKDCHIKRTGNSYIVVHPAVKERLVLVCQS